MGAPGGRPLFLAIDVGTSATKVSLHATDGSIRVAVSEGYGVRVPRAGWAEQDAATWWGAVRRLAPKAIAALGRDEVLGGIAVTGQAPACLPLDEAGEPLRRAILWLDRRSAPQVRTIEERLGDRRRRGVGENRIDSYFGATKWRWYLEEEPERFARTRWLVQPNGFVVTRLTGAVAIDPTQAGLCSPAYDAAAGDWDEAALDALGIPRSLLPPVRPSAEIVGVVTEAAAAATGLPAGVPVVCGAGDFAAACLGAGATGPGSAALMLGTAGNLLLPGVACADDRLMHTRDALGAPLTLGGVLAGGNIQWLAGVLSERGGDDFYARAEAAAAQVEPGAGGLLYLPYLLGERSPIWDPEARGAFVGLSNRHGPGHLYRAVLEGVAFAFRSVAAIAAEASEDAGLARLAGVTAIDGGARSGVWRSILASALGVPVRFGAERSGTGAGSAFLAALGAGAVAGPAAIGDWVETGEPIEPDPVAVRRYEALAPLHAELYERLRPTFHALAGTATD